MYADGVGIDDEAASCPESEESPLLLREAEGEAEQKAYDGSYGSDETAFEKEYLYYGIDRREV